MNIRFTNHLIPTQTPSAIKALFFFCLVGFLSYLSVCFFKHQQYQTIAFLRANKTIEHINKKTTILPVLSSWLSIVRSIASVPHCYLKTVTESEHHQSFSGVCHDMKSIEKLTSIIHQTFAEEMIQQQVVYDPETGFQFGFTNQWDQI